MNALSMTTEGAHALRLPPMPFSNLAPILSDTSETTDDVATIRERTMVFRAGDPAETTHVLISGTVILWKMLGDGRRQILQVVRPGDVFGFCSRARHDATAEAVTTSRVRAIPIVRSTASRADQADFLMHALRRIEALQAHALLLGQMSALERLANFLISYMSGTADHPDARTDDPEIRLFVTREEIGDYLGLTIETVSRCFGKLKAAGIITLDQADRVCVQNPAGLQTIASQSGRAHHPKHGSKGKRNQKGES